VNIGQREIHLVIVDAFFGLESGVFISQILDLRHLHNTVPSFSFWGTTLDLFLFVNDDYRGRKIQFRALSFSRSGIYICILVFWQFAWDPWSKWRRIEEFVCVLSQLPCHNWCPWLCENQGMGFLLIWNEILNSISNLTSLIPDL